MHEWMRACVDERTLPFECLEFIYDYDENLIDNVHQKYLKQQMHF